MSGARCPAVTVLVTAEIPLIAALIAALIAGPARAEPAAGVPASPEGPGSRGPVPVHSHPADLPADVWARLFSWDGQVRAGAVAELPALGTPRAHSWIAHVAHVDRDPRVRLAAAEALGRTTVPGFARLAEEIAARDQDPAVRAAASHSAERLWPLTRTPGRAVAWALFPGGGQFYLRQPAAGAAVLASTAALLAGGGLLLNGSPAGGELGNPGDPRLDGKDPIGFQLVMAAQNLWFTSIFAAYREARRLRGNLGYRTPLNTESIGELMTAPVRGSVLKSPWVWGGVPVMVGLAVGLQALANGGLGGSGRSVFHGDPINVLGRRFSPAAGFALGEAYLGGLFLPVGLGEEALFRGVLQPSLTELWGPWGGWAAASVAFGGIHVFNYVGEGGGLDQAAVAVPFITAVGSYMGLASMKSAYTLSRSVAIHAWYDFLLSTIDFLVDPQHQPFVARVALPL